jgi:alkylglycerol monooxygenase
MAFFIPPTHAIVHKQLNLLYQFWIHTEVVKSIGPLEYVLNTASHHRVHHGANQYCLDKNYAGVLIIWDRLVGWIKRHVILAFRMFGTFEAERADVDIVYGLVDQPQFWNPVKHQVIDSFDFARLYSKCFRYFTMARLWRRQGQ